MTTPKFNITNDSVTVVLGNDVLTYLKSEGESTFNNIRKAIFDEDWETIPALFSKGAKIQDWTNDKFKFVDGQLLCEGETIPVELHSRIVEMAEKDENPTYLLNFWLNLRENPSHRSVEQLFRFLENVGIPIDKDGFIVAYKSVTSDYKDWHTKKVDNSVGAVNEMPRNKISDDPQVACHFGFHVGALEYAKNFHSYNNKMMVCRINPKDVVCIPYDASSQKMRVCRYEVIDEMEVPEHLSSTSYTKNDEDWPIDEDYDDDEYYDDDDEDWCDW